MDSPTNKSQVLQISARRKRELLRYLDGHFDDELLVQCAYYPRPPAFGQPSPCVKCKFDTPNPSCPYAHILLDTRLVYIYEWVTNSKWEGGEEE